MCQGYLARSLDCSVRVRLEGERGSVNIKGPRRNNRNLEYEYEIPADEAREMLERLCQPPLIDKTRYRIRVGRLTWEVDEFHGDNEGLVVAEVELPRLRTPIELPEWVGREVSDDPRYLNVSLAEHPWSRWTDEERYRPERIEHPARAGIVVAGADGCAGGWIIARLELSTGSLRVELAADAHALAAATEDCAVVAIDIPIGLPDSGPRVCDRQARELLAERRSSVFPAPPRPVLAADDYGQACAISQDVDGKKISRQAWNITPRIADVDALLAERPELRTRFFEVHPELCFRAMNSGIPMHHPKRRALGRDERRRLLARYLRAERVDLLFEELVRAAAAEDDLADALAAAWTAARIQRGTAHRIPTLRTPTDARELPMQIWF